MKKTAGGIAFLLFLLVLSSAPAQNWYLSTELGASVADISVSDSGEVWAVLGNTSGEGRIYRYAGGSWSLQTTLFPGGTSELTAVEALDSTHVWAGGLVGTAPLMYFHDGAAWSRQTMSSGVWLDDIYAADMLAVWATGAYIYVTWNGGADWAVDTQGTYHQFGIDGLNQGSEVWTVGGPYSCSNQVLRCQGGAAWSVQTEVANWGAQTVRLYDVCAVTDGDVWAAGPTGHVIRYDGSNWSVFTRVEGQDFNALAARGVADVWAGTEGGRIYRFDGSGWGLQTLLTGQVINAMDATAAEVWVGDSSGNIFRFGAASPTPVGFHTPSPTPPPTATPAPTVSPVPTASAPPTPVPTATAELPPTPPPDCGCVGATQTFRWGDTITEDCALNCDLDYVGTCFTVGTDNITIDGAGHAINCLDTAGDSYGIRLDGRSNVTIRNIGIYHFNYGVYARDCEGIAVLGSVISDNQWWNGIFFSNVTGSFVSGNTLEGNGLNTGGQAIIFSGSSWNQITGNHVENNEVGILLQSSSDHNTIADNEVTNNKTDGILIAGGSDNVLESNRFCSNAWSWNTAAGYSDIRVTIGTGNSGTNNFCDTASGYDDDGTIGCTYSCASPWIYDYDGDGTSDIGVFRDSSGLWAVRFLTRAYFGTSGDLPEPADYDGDGTTDIGIFRASSGLWAVRGLTRAYFGGGYDLPVPGDYDGDGSADVGVFRAANGLWAVRGVTRAWFGGAADEPVYWFAEGPGFAFRPIAVFRESTGLWAVRSLTRAYFGRSGDTPVGGDFSGVAAWRPAVFRPSSGLWAVLGTTRAYFGGSSDLPVPAVYRGDRRDGIGVFRPFSGLWAVRGFTRLYFGSPGDVPVTR